MRVTNVTPPSPPPEAPQLPDEPDEPEPPAPIPANTGRLAGRDDPTRALQERWRAAVEAVRAVSVRHASALANGRILWIRAGEIAIAYTRQAEFHRTVMSGSGKVMAEKALSEHFGQPTKITIDASADAANAAPRSLAEEDATVRQERERGADRQVRSHPAVLAALRLLGGEIEHIQVIEPERPSAAPAADSGELPDN